MNNGRLSAWTAAAGTIAAGLALLAELPVVAGVALVGAIGFGIGAFVFAEDKDKVCPECQGDMRMGSPTAWKQFTLLAVEVRPSVLRMCQHCLEDRFSAEYKRLHEAYAVYSTVQLFPTTYKGRLPVDRQQPMLMLTTDMGGMPDKAGGGREYAEASLKLTAAYLGCDVVFDIEWHAETARLDNFRFKRWSATGFVVNPKLDGIVNG